MPDVRPPQDQTRSPSDPSSGPGEGSGGTEAGKAAAHRLRPRAPSAVVSVRAAFWSSIVLSIVAVGAVAWFLVDPAPPARLRIATGIEDGFYDRLGRGFAFYMQAENVAVDLVPTAGSRENLDLLRRDEPVDAAFVQGGVGSPPPEQTPLRSLATLAIEPLWIFSRDIGSFSELEHRDGVRLAIGAEGSGTRQLMRQLLGLTALTDRVETVPLDGEEASAALLSGEVDMAAYVSSPQTKWVADLLADPAVRLVTFEHIDAITRHLPYASKVELPARVIDYPRAIPATDTTILGVATVLLVRDTLHPAIKQLLLQISTSIARGDAMLGTRGEFPSAELAEYPLDPEAQRYFRYGPTPARLYLPFWAANLIERFWVLMIPIATLFIPILRFGPSTLQWSIRRRIYRWYRDLRELEAAAERASTAAEANAVLEALHDVERQVSDIRVPLAFRDDVYRLRTHVAFVRSELSQGLER